jgi:hypothetical protein
MRGRKYLQIRGVVELKEDDVVMGEEGGVQMCVRRLHSLYLILMEEEIGPLLPAQRYLRAILLVYCVGTLHCHLLVVRDEGIGKLPSLSIPITLI